jgi:hypothetical protein
MLEELVGKVTPLWRIGGRIDSTERVGVVQIAMLELLSALCSGSSPNPQVQTILSTLALLFFFFFFAE